MSFSRLAWVLPPLWVAFLYGRTLTHEFVWDDSYLSLLPMYAALDVQAILTAPGNGHEYLPVRDLTLMIDHALFDTWPGGFHLTNVLLFAVASVLAHRLYLLLLASSSVERLRERAAPLALLTTMVLVSHPLQVEPVAFVTARNALLALVLALAALLSYGHHLRGSGRGLYLLSCVCALAALFSKATAVSLPLLLVLLHLHLKPTDRLGHALRSLAPHCAFTAVAAAVHLWMAQQSGVLAGELSARALVGRLPRVGLIPEFYVYKFVWPVGLTIEYSPREYLEHVVRVGVISAVFWVGLAVIVVRGWRSRSFAWLLALGYLAALLPVLNLFPTQPSLADRYAQIALVWLTPLFLVPLFAGLPRTPAAVLGAALVAVLSVMSFGQTAVWKDDETLFLHAAAVNPRATKQLGNLGMTLWDGGRREEAIRVFERLARVDPDDFRREFALGWQAFDAGDFEKAERLLEAATKKRGRTRHLAFMKLGELYIARGRREEARAAYLRARELARATVTVEAHLEIIERQLARLGGSPSDHPRRAAPYRSR